MFSPNYMKTVGLFSTVFLIFFAISSPSFAQVQIWGASQNGGQDAIGNHFSIFDDGSEYTLKSTFLNEVDGDDPKTKLVLGTDGLYYGTTSSGGENNAGTIYSYSADLGFEVLYSFIPETDGSTSKTDLVFVNPQTIVGSTSTGGENGAGMIFQYSLNTGYENVYALEDTETGSNMTGVLNLNPNDDLIYATCSNGGTFGFGTILAFDLEFNFGVVHHFEGLENGSYPQGGVAISPTNQIYGTTQFGGANAQGAIYKMNGFTNSFEILYHLDAATSDGRYPFGTLSAFGEDAFIGTCSEGGSNGTGSIFSITSDGAYDNLHNLQASTHGAFPKTGLTQVNEDLYLGVAEFGGSNGFGTLYSIDSEGNFTTEHNFSYTEDGSSPIGALTKTETDAVIGTNSSGGVNNRGTIFTFAETEGLNTAHHFSVPKNGAYPQSMINYENSFYGTSESGGHYNSGVIYKTELDGSFSVLHELDPIFGGQSPNGDLSFDQNGLMIGTARFGGALQLGTIFSLAANGDFSPLHHFTGGIEGQFPYSGVTRHSNGITYGTTISGGTFGNGVIYSINSGGEYEVLASLFSFFDGGSPESTLVEGADGKLYGVATTGGTSNQGTMFEFDIDSNTLTVIHNFQGASDGANPKGNLLMHSDGSIYGTTSTGLNGGGSIYKYDVDNGFEMLHALDPVTEGANILGGLSEDEAGNVYGYCTTDGFFGSGSCFKFNETDGIEIVIAFTSEDSPTPAGTPGLFFPECFGSDDCVSEEPCTVGVCNYGLCEQEEINPVFAILDLGSCELGLDIYDIVLSVNLDASPGGFLDIEGQLFELDSDILDYNFTLIGLPADGSDIALTYEFQETGCTGTSGSVGTAPAPCPPVEVTFTVHTSDLEIDPAGIHVGGSFQEWSPEENPLTEIEPGLWESTITVGGGSHEFNFFNGPSLFTGEYVIGDCASNGKRQLEVGEESMAVEYCWSVCEVNCTVGLSELNARINLNIYPNILNAGTAVQVDFDANSTVTGYDVADMNGRIIESNTMNQSGFRIDSSGMKAGMYLVKLKNADNQIIGIGRFIIQ